MSATEITKRSLTQEIIQIDEKADYITRLKDDAIENLLQQKVSLLSAGDQEQLKQEVIAIKGQHTKFMELFTEKQSTIHDVKEEADTVRDYVVEIDRQLEEIQERHRLAMLQLEEKRLYLQERLESIEKLDLVILSIQSTIARSKFINEKDKEAMQRMRQDLLSRTDLDPSQIAEAMAHLDSEMENRDSKHVAELNKYQQQIEELKDDQSNGLDKLHMKKDELIDKIMKLEQSKLNASPSQLCEIEKQLLLLQEELNELNDLLDSAGLTTQEKLDKVLNSRGMALTPSGRIRTGSGRILTMDEARKLGLLEGLDEELMQMYGLKLTASGRILTHSGQLLSRSEAERMGLLLGIELEMYAASNTTTVSESSSSSESTASGILSSDAQYLKMVLGTPLTLALAEITAKHPRDPIHYLGHWLFKYRYNQEIDITKQKELEELITERERLAIIAMRERAEAEARATLTDLIGRVNMEITNREMERELRRIAAEAAENEELESEARDTLGVYNGPTSGQKL